MAKQELANMIWAMANKMRTKIKANEYKDYILGFIFYKFLSDKEEDVLKEQGITIEEFQNMDADDITYLKESYGYAISYGNLFSTWKAMGTKLDAKKVSEGIDDFNKNINPAQKQVFNNIFNTLQNGITKLGDSSGSRDKAVRDIVDMVNRIPRNKESGYDVLGYIYEFLIYKFATAAKDDGAFYTPHEVSKLISLIIADYCKNLKELRVYDPTSGSGSLLRTIGEEAGRYIDENNIKYYGQEKITETYHLTRMNLVMKGIPSQNIIVRNGDTLEDDWPYFDENTAYKPLRVNAVVSNPPYSLNWEPEARTMDERFKKYGLAPSGKADYAFLLHCLYHLDNDGIMAIVLPHGVLFRGESEYRIRKNLCIQHNIETIIGLPANLFYATGIPTIIMVIRKNRPNDDILFIDASQNYEKVKSQNVLRDCDVKRIYDAVKRRRDIEGFAKLVTYFDIEKNDYNLNIPRYVSASVEGETVDFAAIMNGTVPNAEIDFFSKEWTQYKSLRNELLNDIGNGYSCFKDVDVRSIVQNNVDVQEFKKNFGFRVERLNDFLTEMLILDSYKIQTADIRDAIADEIFKTLMDVAVIDGYDAYQYFMNTWKTIETDMTAIGDDLSVCKKTEPNMVIKRVNKEDIEVQDGYRGVIMPFELVGETFFKLKYEKMKSLKEKAGQLEREKEEIYEELDENVKTIVGDGEKFKKTELKRFLKLEIDEDLRHILQRALARIEEIKRINKEVKILRADVEDKIKEKIETLSDEEVKELLIKKWVSPICKDISNITTSVVDAFIKNMEKLNAKYRNPLSLLEKEIANTNAKLIGFIDELTGNETDVIAFRELKALLGGDEDEGK